MAGNDNGDAGGRERILTPPTPTAFHIPDHEPKATRAIWIALVGAVALIVTIALTAHTSLRGDLSELNRTVQTRGETLAIISTKADDVASWRREVDAWRKDVDARLMRIEAATSEIKLLLRRR